MNKIGTIRDQYEWQPKGNQDGWLIEEEKMSKVQPLVDFINHAGELKSTKVRRCVWFFTFMVIESEKKKENSKLFLSSSITLSLSLSPSLSVLLTHSLSLSLSLSYSHTISVSHFHCFSLPHLSLSLCLTHFLLSRTMW